jgi:hypothetical protein
MPAPAFRKLSLKKFGTPEPEGKPTGRPSKDVTPLERKILEENGDALDVLPAPHLEPGAESIEMQSQQITQVEDLMFKGIRTPHLIAQAIKIPEDLAQKYIKAVYARWATLGGHVDVKAQRGEALAYLDLLQQNLWTELSAAKKRVRVQEAQPADKRDRGELAEARRSVKELLAQITQLNTQRTQLYGLTPNVINSIVVMGGSEDYEVLTRIREHGEAKQVLSKLGNFLERAKQMRLAKEQDKAANLTLDV